jgi:hypothetical protein
MQSFINILPLTHSIPHHQSKYVSNIVTKKAGKVIYLRSKIESKVAACCQAVLNQERYFVRQTELDRLGETRGFAKVDEIFEGES